MTPHCAMKNCTSKYDACRKEGLEISFFRFPKNKNVCERWLAKCKLGTDPNTARICSLHFVKDDFERDLRSELLGSKPKKTLKKFSFPSLRSESKLQDSLNENVQDLGNDNVQSGCAAMTQTEETDRSTVTTQTEISANIFICSINVIDTIKEMNIKMNSLRTENDRIKSIVVQKESLIKKYKRQISILSKRQQKNTLTNANLNIKIKEKFKNVFTPTQLTKILKNKKKIHWNQTDITNAFTLRYLSKRCYLYLRNHLNYPLPGISTLQNWCSKKNIREGVLHSMLKYDELRKSRASQRKMEKMKAKIPKH
nr:uncharacterized protein LOC111419587 [Onthophagus taurus]